MPFESPMPSVAPEASVNMPEPVTIFVPQLSVPEIRPVKTGSEIYASS